MSAMVETPKPPETTTRLTRPALQRAIVVYSLYEADTLGEKYWEEWFDFCTAHMHEVLALAYSALAYSALDRLEPRRYVPHYERHALGPAQSRIVEVLRGGPRCARELAEITGIHERNLRKNLVSMMARGWLVKEGVLLRIGELPGEPASIEEPKLEPAETLPLPAPPLAVEKGAVTRGLASDLTGLRVGCFVAVEPTSERYSGQIVWLLRCPDCGAEIKRPAQLVKRGTPRLRPPLCRCAGAVPPEMVERGLAPAPAELTKPPEVGTTSPKREADPEPARPAHQPRPESQYDRLRRLSREAEERRTSSTSGRKAKEPSPPAETDALETWLDSNIGELHRDEVALRGPAPDRDERLFDLPDEEPDDEPEEEARPTGRRVLPYLPHQAPRRRAIPVDVDTLDPDDLESLTMALWAEEQATPKVDLGDDDEPEADDGTDDEVAGGGLLMAEERSGLPPAESREQRRSRRKREVRKLTVSVKRATQRELEIGRLLYPESDYERPRTRGECQGGERPCPYVGCKYSLFLDVSRIGSITLNFPDLEPWELGEPCALDVADRGGATLEDVGALMNMTRERVRQIEDLAMARALRAPGIGALREFAHPGDDGRRRLPVLGVG